jgi:hypothetical protein
VAAGAREFGFRDFYFPLNGALMLHRSWRIHVTRECERHS